MPRFQLLEVGIAAFSRADVAGEWSGPTDDCGFGLALATTAAMNDPCVRIGCPDVPYFEGPMQHMALSRALIMQDEWDENGRWRGLVEDH